jgi:hypothetical protein
LDGADSTSVTLNHGPTVLWVESVSQDNHREFVDGCSLLFMLEIERLFKIQQALPHPSIDHGDRIKGKHA